MQYKKDYPIFRNNKKLVYLDSAATSQKPKEVIDAVVNFYTKYNSNVHRGLYDLSKTAEEIYEGTRKKVAELIGVTNPSEIIFTGNTTEGINLAAFGYFSKILKKGDIVVISEMEHHSNIVPWIKLERTTGIKIFYIPITKNYLLDYTKLLTTNLNLKKVKLISLTHASNVLGTINPLEEIIPKLKLQCVNALIHVDAAQSIPHMPVDVKKLNCDFLTFSSHKMFGPAGLGVLWGRKNLLNFMEPLFLGGHMIETVTKDSATFAQAPQKFEAGTGKLEQVAGLGAAIDYINSLSLKNVQKYEKILTKYALLNLPKIKNIKVFGPSLHTDRLPVFSFNVGNIHPHDVSEILNRNNVCVRAGHHCAQVLMDKLKTSSGTVRASLSIYNTTEDIDKLIEGIREVNKIFKIDK